MIICVCRRLNDKAVEAAIDAGATTPDAVQAHHGCQFNCGKCRPAMDALISGRSECGLQMTHELVAAE